MLDLTGWSGTRMLLAFQPLIPRRERNQREVREKRHHLGSQWNGNMNLRFVWGCWAMWAVSKVTLKLVFWTKLKVGREGGG